jgi:uncharacterized membrane protein YfcA
MFVATLVVLLTACCISSASGFYALSKRKGERAVFGLGGGALAGVSAISTAAHSAAVDLVAMAIAAAYLILALVTARRHRATAGSPPGWYVDQQDTRYLRWYDGTGWTEHLTPIV